MQLTFAAGRCIGKLSSTKEQRELQDKSLPISAAHGNDQVTPPRQVVQSPLSGSVQSPNSSSLESPAAMKNVKLPHFMISPTRVEKHGGALHGLVPHGSNKSPAQRKTGSAAREKT